MTLDFRTYLYTGSIVAVAMIIAVVSALVWPVTANTSHLLIQETLFLLVVLAHRFPIRFQRQAEATLVTVPMFMAVLILHPAEAMLVSAGGMIVAERMLKAPIRVMIFNSAVFGVAAGLAGIAWYGLGQNASTIAVTPIPMLVAGAAGLIQHAINVALVLGMLAIRKGIGFIKSWSSTYVFEVIQEGGLLTLGLIGAILVTEAWWAIVMLFIPFVLARYGFERIVNDAAEKALMAEELELKLKELKELQVQLIQSAKLASVGTLAAGVAHEINNPIFAIAGRAELLLKGGDKHLASEKAVNYVQTIQEMSDRITQIVRQLLDYSRPTDDKIDVSIETIMDGAVGLLGSKLTSKRLEIARDFTASSTVCGVENQLQQVFVNLIGNAIDATSEWGEITMGSRMGDDGMVIAYVKDTGVGVAPEFKEKLFEPFFTTKAPGKGTGLGLFICHTIVTNHDGEMGLDSTQGEGTTVWVKLPTSASTSRPKPVVIDTGVNAITQSVVAINERR